MNNKLDLDSKKWKSIEELRSEMKKKDIEIVNLRNIVYNNNSHNIVNENKMKEMEDRIYSYKCKLYGMNEDYSKLKLEVQQLYDDKKLLVEKYQKACEKVNYKSDDLEKLQNSKRKIENLQSRFVKYFFY